MKHLDVNEIFVHIKMRIFNEVQETNFHGMRMEYDMEGMQY